MKLQFSNGMLLAGLAAVVAVAAGSGVDLAESSFGNQSSRARPEASRNLGRLIMRSKPTTPSTTIYRLTSGRWTAKTNRSCAGKLARS